MLLFFGYIENYTAPLLFLLLFVIAGFRALHRMASPWVAGLPLLCAIYAHVQCVLFVPAFVYLILWTRLPGRHDLLLRRWMPVFTLATIAVVAGVTLYPPIRRFYVPIGFSNSAYALFSPDHLLDIANEFLILLPILPTIAVLMWVGRRAERAGGRDPLRAASARKHPTAWFSHPAEWQFAATIFVPCAIYMVLFHPEIGMARDWDLFAMMSTAVVPLALLAVNRYARVTAATPETMARLAVPSLLLVVVLGVSWVAVNASAERSVDRFQRILTYDKTHASYAWENLAILQHDSGQLKEAIATMEQAVNVSHNPRQIVRLAVYIEEDGRIDEAIVMLDDVLERRPEFSKARFRLVLFLEKTGQWDRMLTVARGGIEHSPGDAIYRFFYGESLLRAGQTEEAITIFRTCQNLDLPKAAKEYLNAIVAKHDAK
jgi:tetratricopeptide (TPR) repeat protein